MFKGLFMLVLLQLITLIKSRELSISHFETYLDNAIADLDDSFDIDSLIAEIENNYHLDLNGSQHDNLRRVLLNGNYKSAFKMVA
jgi:hypothetical protein